MKANNQKLTREEFNVFIENIPLGEEDKQVLKEAATHLYDFNDFMCKKLNTTSFAVEAIMELNVQLMLKKFVEENEDSINSEDDVLKASGKIASDYAKKMEFSDYEKVGKASIDIINVLKKLAEV